MPPQASSRKRPAPGSSPTIQQSSTSLHLPPGSTSPPLTDEQFFKWGQNAAANTSSYPEPAAAYSANLYHGVTGNMTSMAQAAQTANTQRPTSTPSSPSNQLARRSMNQSLVSRGPRAFNSNANAAPWPGDFGDEAGLELQGTSGWINNDEHLEQRALQAKREAQAKRKQIPPFVQKLSSFLDQSKNTDLIRWSDSGDSFIVLDEDEFAKTLIPELFKHNNYASFVRQLNMYGFHKKVGLSDNSMKASERKNKSPSEYHNPYFKRGHPDLLWLINKPKNSQASHRDGKKSGRKGGVKTEEGDRGSDDDVSGDDRDEFSKGQLGQHDTSRSIASGGGGGGGSGGSRGLIAPSEAGGIMAKRELADVRSQLESIRQHQKVISTHINRLRKDHNQLYEQAVAFQTLHDRHESSINAILTFLATVYNRSLEGHGGQNFATMFGNAIPHDTQGQGNVVDVGDVGDQSPENQVQRRFRRQPLMLTAPPSSGQTGESGRVSTVSPAASGSSAQAFQALYDQSQQSPYLQSNQAQVATQPGAIEELFESRSSAQSANSPPIKPDAGAQSTPQDMPQKDILSIINSANASNNIQGVRYDFPTVLSHYETSNGNSPLTPKQRNAMLHLIANNTNASAAGTNNALLSSTPPPVPSLDRFGNTQQEIDMLAKLQAEQDTKVQNLASMVQPLSPTGEIPGLTDGQYYNGQGLDGGPGALDLDQFFNSGDYFPNQGNGDMDFVTDVGLGDGANIFDGTADGDGGANNDDNDRIVEALDSSESTSPSNTIHTIEDKTPEEIGSPSKRRRRG
ncbi:hypothetical protein GP486_004405 [Trichoglossum hirsutum]|uniref:HSF-type DNA-binding domain-containing protein n=1 Tax=Trichoglossum hirsutum TaxID=265104 RepID=A0A9P8LB88_9PEZI|nr:hypothetical protein GP486_004405 [Trichoglossum hirsutum]